LRGGKEPHHHSKFTTPFPRFFNGRDIAASLIEWFWANNRLTRKDPAVLDKLWYVGVSQRFPNGRRDISLGPTIWHIGHTPEVSVPGDWRAFCDPGQLIASQPSELRNRPKEKASDF
jgi:hypothetical protein